MLPFMHFKEESRFTSAIARFDELNGKDPNHLVVDGVGVPKELHDALAMTRWVETLYPQASEAVFLAARCQHLCRWEIPRTTYPEGKAGYHKWRNALKRFHSERSAEVLHECGYEPEIIDLVVTINQKKGLKDNEAVQQIEDALCLVFLECQFDGYLDKWDEDKMIRILQKTWAKMSDVGHAAALKLSYSDRGQRVIGRALAD